MKIPYVIDNQNHQLGEILAGLLAKHQGRSLDVATAYFTVGGYSLLKAGLSGLGSFRLLLGAEPATGKDIGLEPGPGAVKGLIRRDLEDLPLDEQTCRDVEDLIAFLRRQEIEVRLYKKGFLHAKAWLFYSDRPGQQWLFDRFRPVAAIVGSSNFTRPGLTSNRELNLSHKVLLDPEEASDPDARASVGWLTEEKASPNINPTSRQLIKSEVGARAIIDLEQWYLSQWEASCDYKQDLIGLLDASKFGKKEYTPYQVYMKALYSYFSDDLSQEAPAATRTAVELSEFQEDAVKKARKILARYHGVLISDSVGLGKTWIGKRLLEESAYHLRQKALIVCPASLREMWQREMTDAAIAGQVISQEELGREDFDWQDYGDADILLVDESHNFRNRNSNRYMNLERILSANNRRGRDGYRKKVVLLTATPINNDIIDLYNQICLITMNDRSYFSTAGIGDLQRYFLQARSGSRQRNLAVSLFNLLEEIVIRRTRPFIKKAYPDATIRGEKIRYPGRELRTVQYNLEQTYSGIYDDIVGGIENLKLVPYNLESYKKKGVKIDEFEQGREQALVGIFKSRYLKRFESSVEAFRISIRRAIQFFETFESYMLDGRLMRSDKFHKAMRFLEIEDPEDDATPGSLAKVMDGSEEACSILREMESIDTKAFNLRHIHEDLRSDLEILGRLWDKIKDIGCQDDAKLAMIKTLLSAPSDQIVGYGPNGDPIHGLRGKKVLLFSYYKDTTRYLYRHLGHPESADAQEFRAAAGSPHIRRMDSDSEPNERKRAVQAFAPKSNARPEIAGTGKEIDVLISTDVLSEGQNLQDCGTLINYDLHWNPTRMVQRAGRIDRIGTPFEKLFIYNMFPDAGLENLLGIVHSLTSKISSIDQAGFLDASVLGETVHPQNFNTLRRIREEDNSVIEEEEQFTELASNEFLLQQLRGLLDAGGQEMLDSLPDGIYSGQAKRNTRGIFFYFLAKPPGGEVQHFWRCLDLVSGEIINNRYEIGNLISCQKDTPRVIDGNLFESVFEYQERVIEDILKSVQRQQALEAVPGKVDPIQQTVSTTLQNYLNYPQINRSNAVRMIYGLSHPLLHVQITRLRSAYNRFHSNQDIQELMNQVEDILGNTQNEIQSHDKTQASPRIKLEREHLRLICFEFFSGS